jgi:L-2-hydroxyglutarate oxidase LhgO
MQILIVGGGIVGLASAYRLAQRLPAVKITVLEKETQVGQHQTGHNSGVLHCGLYYKPGSLKARMAVNGIRQMIEFCAQNDVPHEICGKLVVAADAGEIPRLEALFWRGRENGLRGLEILGPEQIKKVEPHAGGVAALRVPEEGIVDYGAVCQALLRHIYRAGGKVVTGACVRRLEHRSFGWIAHTTAGEFEGDFLVNCAGLHCDRVSSMAGLKRELRIIPFRGEYYTIRPEKQYLVRNLIYPVPDPKFPFLGVHFTRLIYGGVEAGPNAVLALAREGYRKTDISLRDLADILSYEGFWRFMLRYPRMCLDELLRSFSKKLFCRSLQRLVPEIQLEDLQPGGAGVRAQAIAPDGALVQDFYFARSDRSLHVLNAPSPAATASLAIGDKIASEIFRATAAKGHS